MGTIRQRKVFIERHFKTAVIGRRRIKIYNQLCNLKFYTLYCLLLVVLSGYLRYDANLSLICVGRVIFIITLEVKWIIAWIITVVKLLTS